MPEKKTKRLSIIIPFYNVEKYIAQCLQSIYAQDISEEDYEVICVNDCSPDNSREVVLEFQKEHKNLKLIEHRTNTMQGGARNTGLRAAQGKYVWFIDSDDFIKENCLAKLLNILEQRNLDILRFDFQTVDENGHCLGADTVNFPANKVTEGKQVFLHFKDQSDFDNSWRKVTCFTWSRIVKRSFLTDNNIFYYQNFYGEDSPVGVKCYLFAKRFLYLPERVLYYRQRQNSDMQQRYQPENKGFFYASQYKTLVETIKIAETVEDEEVKAILFKQIKLYASDEKAGFRFLLSFTPQQRRQFYEHLKKIDDLRLVFPYIGKKARFTLISQQGIKLLHGFKNKITYHL
ncbi:MAG: glycosyltransferase [Dysgonamonadaceae bacterium]|nr:glycosyltransferase [Dysgonamonadaceae bacterium]